MIGLYSKAIPSCQTYQRYYQISILNDTYMPKTAITTTQDSWSWRRLNHCVWPIPYYQLLAYLPRFNRFGLTIALKNRGALQLQGSQPGGFDCNIPLQALSCTDCSRTDQLVWLYMPRKPVSYDINTAPPCNSLDAKVTSVLPNSSEISVSRRFSSGPIPTEFRMT
jgi:hypothetical protein